MHRNDTECPVCGFPGLDAAAYSKGGDPSFEICPCCGTEFGYHDSRTSHSDLRLKWIKDGMPWHSKSHIPPRGWDPVEQIRSVKK